MLGKVSKILLLIALVFHFSCEKDNPASIDFDLTAQVFKNESYGTDSKQQFDIYLPAGRNNKTPVVVLIHGGFWSAGDKEDLTSWVNLLLPNWNDYAIVNTNYRLATATENKHPTQFIDLQLLFEKLKNDATSYQISTNYYVIGISAGGHLGLLYSYLSDTEKAVKAVCSVVGPTDFTDPYYTNEDSFFGDIGTLFLGESYNSNPNLYAEASPISHLDASDPPTLLFYGANDLLVPPSQPERLTTKLNLINLDYEYTLFENAGHDLGTANLVFMLATTKSFFDSYK